MNANLGQRIKTLEQRVAALERLSRRGKLAGLLKRAGWAKDDALYDEAMRLGATWRRKS